MIAEPEKCTGCGVCRNLCPQNAVRMETDREGFLSPVIDARLCTGCGLCRRKCPQNNPPEPERDEVPATYACWNLDAEKRRFSSSGGMFTLYAELILSRGGVVFGAGLDAGQNVLFCAARTPAELAHLRCSKYVQADTHEIYRRVKEVLDAGREALFTGTPCQVAALYAFLNGDPPNLYTCDLICHGVPSPLFYRKWLDHLKQKFGGPVLSINMRAKELRAYAMAVDFEVGSPPRHLTFSWRSRDIEYLGWAFLTNLSLRKCCFACPYIKTPRLGDITLGDFWKLGNLGGEEDEKRNGISLNLINSKKGRALLADAQKGARLIERDFAEAVSGNLTLREATPPHPKRDAFVLDTVAYDYAALLHKYRKDQLLLRWKRMKMRVKRFLRRFFPKR